VNPFAFTFLLLGILCFPGAMYVGGFNGVWLLGVVFILACLIIQAFSAAPDDSVDLSRLDELYGVGQRFDLTELSDEELEAVGQDRLDDARAHIGEPGFEAAIDRHAEVVAEQERRLNILRARVGWVWPEEVA
jgi:hypothetical protein